MLRAASRTSRWKISVRTLLSGATVRGSVRSGLERSSGPAFHKSAFTTFPRYPKQETFLRSDATAVLVTFGLAVSAAAVTSVYQYWAVVPFAEAEKQQWLDHNVRIDESHKMKMMPLLDNFKVGEEVFLCYVERNFNGVPFQHWFITNHSWVYEFGSPNIDIFNARVEISPRVHEKYVTHRDYKLTAEMKERMEHLLGMKNYSLCLRNCEHVANFVARGRWVSTQMDLSSNGTLSSGALFKRFGKYQMGNVVKIVNCFPENLRVKFAADANRQTIYPFLDRSDTPVFTEVAHSINDMEKTRNILVLGAMGAGKSRIINAFFNAHVCQEETSLTSVTKEITFVRGDRLYSSKESGTYEKEKLVVIDTVGLGDRDWTESELHELIRNRVGSNTPKIHGVLILLSSVERISAALEDSIKALLKLLQYENHPTLFYFLLTKEDNITEGANATIPEVKQRLEKQLRTLLQTTKYVAGSEEKLPVQIYFTSLPPAHSISDNVDKQEEIKQLYKETLRRPLEHRKDEVINIDARGPSCQVM